MAGTERKQPTFDIQTEIYMDQATTPLKTSPDETRVSPDKKAVSATSRHREILLKLD